MNTNTATLTIAVERRPLTLGDDDGRLGRSSSSMSSGRRVLRATSTGTRTGTGWTLSWTIVTMTAFAVMIMATAATTAAAVMDAEAVSSSSSSAILDVGWPIHDRTVTTDTYLPWIVELYHRHMHTCVQHWDLTHPPAQANTNTIGIDAAAEEDDDSEGESEDVVDESSSSSSSSSEDQAEELPEPEQQETKEKQDQLHPCYVSEGDRIDMNRNQPASMRNYTTLGYHKMRAPTAVYNLLRTFWDQNLQNHRQQRLDSAPGLVHEKWSGGQIYVNNWQVPSLMMSLENATLIGGGDVLRRHVWDASRDTLQAWTGQKQVSCSLYGVRVYQHGAILAPHVDRNPLVASAIINVDQDVDELWPLQVIGHDGITRNITMLPGDMVLYESHSIIHGRPFPLQGRFMANVFVHFEPIGPMNSSRVDFTGDLPPYVLPNSYSETRWRKNHPQGHTLSNNRHLRINTVDGTDLLAHDILLRYSSSSSRLHKDQQDLEDAYYAELVTFLDQVPDAVYHRDNNGWTALAEAVRAEGHRMSMNHSDSDAVTDPSSFRMTQLLLDRGADINARLAPPDRVHRGWSILYYFQHKESWANTTAATATSTSTMHPMIRFLQERGAVAIAPGESVREDNNIHRNNPEAVVAAAASLLVEGGVSGAATRTTTTDEL